MKLLIAEDDRALSKTLSTILKINNYNVDAVFNGADAYTYAVNGEYDIIILDVNMPKMNGFEVLKALRAGRNYTPIIMLTAKVDVKDKVMGLDLGADDYLAKPFATDELLARLRTLARRKSATPKLDFVFGDLELDIKSFCIKKEDKSVELSGKEFKICKLLFEAEGKVVTNDRIIDNAWDYDNPADSSNVMIFITKLRKKFDSLGSNVEIKSVKGIGYHLKEKDL